MSMRDRISLKGPNHPSPWCDLGLIAAAFALLAACLWEWGCGERAAANVAMAATRPALAKAIPAPPAPTSTKDADAQIKQAHAERDAMAAERDELSGQIIAKDQHIGVLVKEEARLRDLDLEHQFQWISGIAAWIKAARSAVIPSAVSGIAAIAILAALGLWFVLPTGLKSWAVYLGLGAAAISAGALGLAALVPYRQVAGLFLVAAGAAFGLWKLARFKRAGVKGADYGEDLEAAFVGMKAWIPTELHDRVDAAIAGVKHDAALEQAEAGVRTVLAAMRGKDPAKPTTPPAVLAPPPTAGPA